MSKSLEIVRDKLYILEKYPAKIETVKLEKDVLINQEQLLKIEQDLEVLEILKGHLVLIPTGTNKEQLFIATDITNYLSEKDKEKFNKLKQWLEVNENDR